MTALHDDQGARGEPADATGPGPQPHGVQAADVQTADVQAGAGEPEAAEAPDLLTAPDPLAEMARERDEYVGALQRLQADFENYRKRVLRQQEEQAARAASDLVGKLLPVLDVLDLAEAHLGGPGAGSADSGALVQARTLLLDVLAKEGLERVDAAGVAFDPVVHDAVAHAPVDEEPTGSAPPRDPEGNGEGGPAPVPPGSMLVDGVLRAGYLWKGQVLRPAMVRVRG